MIVAGYDGVLVNLELGAKALAKMESLVAAAESAYGDLQ